MRLTYRTFRIALNCEPTFTLNVDQYDMTAQVWTYIAWNMQGVKVIDSVAEGFPSQATIDACASVVMNRIDAIINDDFLPPEVTPITSPF